MISTVWKDCYKKWYWYWRLFASISRYLSCLVRSMIWKPGTLSHISYSISHPGHPALRRCFLCREQWMLFSAVGRPRFEFTRLFTISIITVITIINNIINVYISTVNQNFLRSASALLCTIATARRDEKTFVCIMLCVCLNNLLILHEPRTRNAIVCLKDGCVIIIVYLI